MTLKEISNKNGEVVLQDSSNKFYKLTDEGLFTGNSVRNISTFESAGSFGNDSQSIKKKTFY